MRVLRLDLAAAAAQEIDVRAKTEHKRRGEEVIISVHTAILQTVQGHRALYLLQGHCVLYLQTWYLFLRRPAAALY